MKKDKLISLSLFLLITINAYPMGEKTTIQSVTIETLYVDDDAPTEWYNETHFRTIMDAINNSNDGVTVFVYNGTYYEKVVINKSINLIGENKFGTIIDCSNIPGDENINGLLICANYITVDSFTVQNVKDTGLSVSSNNNNISNCIIKNISSFGIIISGNDNTIYNNSIIVSGAGIISNADNSTIMGNTIIGSFEGISLDGARRNTITLNYVEGCYRGIVLFESNNNIIKRNNIAHNYYNVFLGLSWLNKFYENNFIDCDNIGKHVVLKGYSFFNKWRGNYWDNQIIHLLPKVILGRFGILPIPLLKVDWRPARKPYEI